MTHREEVPFTHRKHAILIGPDTERQVLFPLTLYHDPPAFSILHAILIGPDTERQVWHTSKSYQRT